MSSKCVLCVFLVCSSCFLGGYLSGIGLRCWYVECVGVSKSVIRVCVVSVACVICMY